jgi:thiamine biosynthesis protein ThiS
VPEIEIVVNGERTSVPEGLTVLNVLKSLGLEPSRVALEYDGAILKSAEWPNRVVHPGARLEIVHFVGGG